MSMNMIMIASMHIDVSAQHLLCCCQVVVDSALF